MFDPFGAIRDKTEMLVGVCWTSRAVIRPYKDTAYDTRVVGVVMRHTLNLSLKLLFTF